MTITTPQKTQDWYPNEGPQTEVLLRTEFEVGFGGSRGGGKSEAGLAWLMYDFKHPLYRALVIRRNSTDLDAWLDRASLFFKPFGGEKRGRDIVFPWGAIIRTGHLKDDNAYSKYQGHEYCRMLIEELTQIASEDNYIKLLASCRSSIPELVPQVFSSFNPDGPGFFWVRERFNIRGTPDKPIVTQDKDTGLMRVFVPSRLSDNPYLNQSPHYRAFLNGLPDGLREAWRDGSWNDPVIEGAYYTKELIQARAEGRIGTIPFDPKLKVHTVWDLGMDDSMTILFVQKTATDVRIIDSYSNENFGLQHYQAVLQKKANDYGYVYGKHYAPHDGNKRELTTGEAVVVTAAKMGLKFEIVPIARVEGGIQKVRLLFPKLYIDEHKAQQAYNAFLNYRHEWDEQLLKFKDTAVHDWSSHYADALRYLATIEHLLTNKESGTTELPHRQREYERPGTPKKP